MADDSMTETQRELWDRIEEVRTAMMTTVELDGSLRSRPMWTQGDEFDGSLWFFASDDGALADELYTRAAGRAKLGTPDKDLYVSVSGRGELVRDKARAEEMWNTFGPGVVPRWRQ